MNRQELIDSINTYLGDTVYVCTRVWEAWNYGTMSRDDFHLASEDENVASDIADIVMKVIESLESENEQLTQDNLDLMKQVEEQGLKHEKLIERACDYFENHDICMKQDGDCIDSFITCEQCWREWLEKGE